MKPTLPQMMRDATHSRGDHRNLLMSGAAEIERLTSQVALLEKDAQNAEQASKYYEEMSIRLRERLALLGHPHDRHSCSRSDECPRPK